VSGGYRPEMTRKVKLAFLMFASILPAMCAAQAKCPWIAEATARGVLGGNVAANIKLNERHEGVCEFSRQQESVALQLRISVETMTNVGKEFPSYLAQCPAKSSPVTAIGNEAVECSVQDAESHYVEKIVSRVRNQAFVVSITSTAANDALMPKKARREKTYLVAEQVAGILF
jgi:hypothetical protein